MQLQSSKFSGEVWSRLKNIFNLYSQGRDTIGCSQLERVVREVLKEDSPHEVDYVLNNMSKIDVDSNGCIDYPEFATFLLKRHCGQIALQKMHSKNRISHGKDRKITFDEFVTLLNMAYSFLGVVVRPQDAKDVFKTADTDSDGLITYVQYFSFIDQFLCKPLSASKIKSKATTTSATQMLSRLRRFMWQSLRQIYERYDANKNGQLDINELQTIIRLVLGLTDPEDIDFILYSLLKMTETKQISFNQFVSFFLKYSAQLGLTRFHKLGSSFAYKLTRDQFVRLIRKSFSFMDVGRLTDELLYKIFLKVDKDSDGWISNQEYLTWVYAFLCPPTYRGLDYYVQEDDESIASGTIFILTESNGSRQSKNMATSIVPGQLKVPEPEIRQIISVPYISESSNTSSVHKANSVPSRIPRPSGVSQNSMRYSSFDLAIRIRRQVQHLVRRFDANNNELLEQSEIVTLLKTLLKETDHEVRYVITNISRYDKDNDKNVTFDQMTNFLLEYHSGQMAIQRMHMQGVYERGAERKMSQTQFYKTINYAFSFFQMEATPDELRTLFNQVDTDLDGWISYQEYFEFLKFYFGGQSYVFISGLDRVQIEPKGIDMSHILKPSNINIMSVVQDGDFCRDIWSQLRKVYNSYDSSKSDRMNLKDLDLFCRQALLQSSTKQLNYIKVLLGKYHNKRNQNVDNNAISFSQFAPFILDYMAETALKRYHLQQKPGKEQLSRDQFLLVVRSAYNFLKAAVNKVDLIHRVFDQLDRTNSSKIAYSQFLAWVHFDLAKTAK